MGKRVFFALDIDDAMRDRIVAAAGPLMSLPGKINWTKPQNLHVTMNFIGAVDDDRVGELCELAAEVVRRWGGREVAFTVGPLACIPPGRRARMIWAPLTGGREMAASLHDELNRALDRAGWPSESRPFKGHITVARIKSADVAGAVRALDDSELGQMRVRELTIYESTLTPAGPIYSPLRRIGFSPAGE
jgi:RNA 2',3'-cyclic 3'-phosphodiesterase